MFVVASNGGLTAGVHATKGEVAAGTPDGLSGGWDKTCGATMAWFATWGGADALVPAALAGGTCGGAGPEMIRTWLPGPKPWEGTTKRVLFRMICVPAASGAEVLMTILCWIVPAADVMDGAHVPEERDVLGASGLGNENLSSTTSFWTFDCWWISEVDL